MKKLVLTLAVKSPVAQYTVPVIKDYAKKIGADFKLIDSQKLFKRFPHYEKFQIYELLEEYDRIAYMDCDVLVTPKCPDIFEKNPEDKLAMFNEGGYMPWDGVLQEAAVRYDMTFDKKNSQYYNTGVMVIPRSAREVFVAPSFEQDVFSGCTAYDQPYINLRIRKLGLKVHDLDYKFNRLEYIDRMTGEPRFMAWIIHYAGIPDDKRMAIIPKDIEELKENKEYKRNVLITFSGGMGDQIASEPVARYVVEKLYPDQNIKLLTNWPELFGHLGIPVIKSSEWKPDTLSYYTMETIPSDGAPLWQYLSQAVCHTTDFASIACLRTIISEDDKTIKLKVNDRSFTKLGKLIKVPLEELFLVHPGRGWNSKTFPKIWWETVINLLLKAGRRVAVIGKHIGKDQGYVELDIPDEAIDLLDLLDTQDLVALISKAVCVISNDSAPIHIAGAFDNYIVLIPTCKHPDHVLPYRHGCKTYKALAIYKKLTVDALNNSPTNLNGETIDRVVGDILDYLPDPEEVVEKTLRYIDSSSI